MCIYDSPGLVRPSWMDDEEWSEYQMTDEARMELTYESEPPEYDDQNDSYWDWYAERVRELEEEGLSTSDAQAVIDAECERV